MITPDGYFDVILQVFSENWGTVSGIEHSKISFYFTDSWFTMTPN